MSATAKVTLDELPLRDELRGEVPYGAPQLDVAVQLNTNENPYPPSAAVVADIAAALAEVAAGLNRYPDREAVALRADAGRLPGHRGAPGITGDEVWAANGSNEVMQQLLHGLRRARAHALSFAPTYSMYPEYARDTAHAVGVRSPGATTSASTGRRR